MKHLFSVTLFLALFSNLFAQPADSLSTKTVQKNIALEFSAGYVFGLGDYASQDMQQEKSGYATGGWQLQVTFDWMGKKNLGLGMQYTFQRNPMENAANGVYPYPTGIPDSLGSKAWSNHYLMFGPVFMMPVGKLHLEAKLLGGAIISSSALFDTRDPTDTTGMKFNTNVAAGFAYQISAGVGYHISPKFAFKFNLTLIGAWPVMSRQYASQYLGMVKYIDPVTGLPDYEPVYSAPIDYKITKVVTTLSPSIGIFYRF